MHVDTGATSDNSECIRNIGHDAIGTGDLEVLARSKCERTNAKPVELVKRAEVRVGGSNRLPRGDGHEGVIGKIGHRELDLYTSEWDGLATTRDRERIGWQITVEN